MAGALSKFSLTGGIPISAALRRMMISLNSAESLLSISQFQQPVIRKSSNKWLEGSEEEATRNQSQKQAKH